MEKVTKKDLLNKDKEIDNKQQMQLELKEIKPIFQIISDLVKAVAYNTTFDEKNNINVIKILDTIEETEKVPLNLKFKIRVYLTIMYYYIEL